MRRLLFELERCPEELQQGLTEIRAERPHRFQPGKQAVRLEFEREEAGPEAGFSVGWEGSDARVAYATRTAAFRAIGRLLGGADGPGDDFSERPRLDTLGVMVDCSRNGVMRPDAVKKLLRRCALMGLNMLMLYTEDTYEVPGEPFFGYLRGRYSEEELHELDRYAAVFGIEMMPCIQTLAHLEQILQWPAYADYRDTGGVILADEERTYELVEKLVAAASQPFRSPRIHLGMDEAHGIGQGRYRQRHGEKSSFHILNNHLMRVREICREQGLEPMIWSDMYFRLGSESNDYYDPDSRVPDQVVEGIPDDVDLVYWDYYHCEPDFYQAMIEKHRELGKEPIVAGGAWTWNHLWAALPYAFSTTDVCMVACKREGVREAFITLWGDDGMECDVFSALPALQFFAEHGYADDVDPMLLRANFSGTCDARFDHWQRAADLDSVPCLEDHARSHNNLSKWLLWEDPLIGHLQPQLEGVSLREHYEQLDEELREAAERGGECERLLFPAQVARVLSVKCELRRELVRAYRDENKLRMRELLQWDVVSLRREVEDLWKRHRRMWLETYKPFGLEVLERRYGGLLARIDDMFDRVKGYLEDERTRIPEFETELRKIYAQGPGNLPTINYARAATPSCIK
ncbi:MAG: beta-N-acetylhexosaminidase [Planctomycetota bacterium]